MGSNHVGEAFYGGSAWHEEDPMFSLQHLHFKGGDMKETLGWDLEDLLSDLTTLILMDQGSEYI